MKNDEMIMEDFENYIFSNGFSDLHLLIDCIKNNIFIDKDGLPEMDYNKVIKDYCRRFLRGVKIAKRKLLKGE